jgi:AraC family transcriptional regulator
MTGYVDSIAELVAEITRRLDDPPGYRELAERAHLSPYHFHRMFRAVVGESPRELARRLRLERAAHRLVHSPDPVVDVAFDAGFATHEAFTKAFQSEFGAAPSAYRRASGNCVIPAPCGVHFVGGGFTRFHIAHRRGEDMKLDVVERDEQRLAAIRHVGPYWQIGRAFGQLMPRVAQQGLRPTGAPVAAFLSDVDSVPVDELQSVAGVPVSGDAEVGDLDEYVLAGGRFLRATFLGHHDGLTEAWQTLYGRLIPDGGYRLRPDVCYAPID